MNAKPKLVVKTKEGQLYYLYKLETGECWYEYTEVGGEIDPEKEDLLNSLGDEKIVELSNPLQEQAFMSKYIEYIVDPQM